MIFRKKTAKMLRLKILNSTCFFCFAILLQKHNFTKDIFILLEFLLKLSKVSFTI